MRVVINMILCYTPLDWASIFLSLDRPFGPKCTGDSNRLSFTTYLACIQS